MTEDTLIVNESISKIPELAFLGVGWIGKNRMNAIVNQGLGKCAIIADTDYTNAISAQESIPNRAKLLISLEEIIAEQPAGVLIATPSALHAEQAIKALENNIPVFCQKPLGRAAREVKSVIDTARKQDLLLGLDLSYRFTHAMAKIDELIKSGELGEIFAVNLVFHNAYGPDKTWFYDRKSSGGGCLIDLGVHLLDLAMWTLDFPEVSNISGNLYAQGKLLKGNDLQVEDFASAGFRTSKGTAVQLACSWNLPAGRDAEIEASFYGTKGGARFYNVNGSFYDFKADYYKGTSCNTISAPPDNWGGRAAMDWTKKLAAGQKFDPQADQYVKIAEIIDAIYGR